MKLCFASIFDVSMRVFSMLNYYCCCFSARQQDKLYFS